MKIAHILGSLGMGGAERVALDLAYEQKKLGHATLVLSLGAEAGGALASAFENADIEIVHILKRPGIDWRLPAKIAWVLRKHHVDVAHTHNTAPLIYGAAVARLAGLSVIHTKHGQGHLISKGGKALGKLGAPFVHHYVSVSEATAVHARQQKSYPFPKRMHVIRNGIRLDRICPNKEAKRRIRKELGIADDVWVVGTIGRVDANKNQVALVRAMEPLLSPHCQLVLVGDGPKLQSLRDHVSGSVHREFIHILGMRHDAHHVLASFDAFALPSLSEGLPLVILEAMATEIPIVSNNVGGIAKVIQDRTSGLLVEASDETGMTERLKELRNRPELCRDMSNAARKVVLETYSATRMAQKYLSLYSKQKITAI